MDPRVDEYLAAQGKWQKELTLLREIILQSGLEEDYKWMHPCYTLKGKNIALIHEFKDYCAILFHKGALLDDKEGLLVQQSENVQSARQIRFHDTKTIYKQEKLIKAYLYEAIEIEGKGIKIEYKDSSRYEKPEELLDVFKKNEAFKEQFEALTPGRQKGYLLYFLGAKQSKTKMDRIEKHIPRIMLGKGIRDCICGKSKRYPICDGSHKDLD
ncbi:MAG: DUF1801 domain-containing protein [Cytophagales bacterium]